MARETIRSWESDTVARAVLADRIIRRILVPILFLALLILYAIGLLDVPIGPVIGLFVIYLFSNELTMWLFRHQVIRRPDRIYGLQLLADIAVLIIGIHLTGGILSFAMFLLPIIIIVAGLVLSAWQCIAITAFACVSLAVLIAAESTGLLPHQPVLPPTLAVAMHTYHGYTLMMMTTVISSMIVIAVITIYISGLARRHKQALEQARAEIEQWSRTLEDKVRQRTSELSIIHQDLQQLYIDVVKSLLLAIDAKDHYTQAHSAAVSRYANLIAKEMKLSPKESRDIQLACQLHDVGKIGIHDHILTKKSSLTPEEWEEMRLHPIKGAKILEPLTFLKEAQLMILQEHERYDGGGYPSRLKGEEICLGARIVAVADAYDAMTSQRPYNTPLSHEAAMAEIIRCKNSQFDPRTADAFVRAMEKHPPARTATDH